MKKTYDRPQARTFLLQSSTLMLGTSNTVNNYKQGNDITVGDTDGSGVKAHNHMDWNEW